MSKFRILSFDGGGLRGIIPAIILQKLIEDPRTSIFLNDVNLYAGTSTGGLLALGLADGRTPEYMRDIYANEGKNIFDDSWLDDVLDFGKTFGADYRTENLEKVLKDIFGQKKLSNLQESVLVTTFNLDNKKTRINERTWKPKIFHNLKGEGSDENELVYKIGLYSSAAPTYFPSVDGYIDGGVYANNPTMCAVTQSQEKRYFPNSSLSDVVVLSFGTGISHFYIEGSELDWGFVQWAKPLISIMMDGVGGIADYQCKQLLGDNYHRCSPVFPQGVSVPLDSVEKIPYTIKFAEDFCSSGLSEVIDWIVKVWN